MAPSYLASLGLACTMALTYAKRSNHQSQELAQPPGFGGFGDFGAGNFPNMPGGFGDFGGGKPGAQKDDKKGGFPGMPGMGGFGDDGAADFGGGFGGGGFPGFPKPGGQSQAGGGGGGPFPGVDMGGMMDMMGGMMADALNCGQKEMEVACKDPSFHKATMVPLWYCLIATGDRDFGPVPPCHSPIKIGDATKCKKSDEDLRKEMEAAKSMCFGRLKELYDLQAQLGQCAVGIKQETEKVESERQALQSIQHEAEECEKTKAKKKAEESMGSSFSGQGQGQFCPAHATELKDAFAKYTLAVEQCISVQVSATVHIPEIDIVVPEIKVGQVQGTSFNIQMPDFNAPDFTGDIVVPGGGGKLNVAVEHHGQQGQSEGQQEAKLTFDQRVANIKADIKTCEEAKPKMQQKSKEIAESKSTVQEQKQKACETAGSLLQTGASPEATIAIQVFSMMKMTWGCHEVAAAIDGLVAVLQSC
mmetsp:Transcript_30442/g.72560  ORF Transcript_30442/g.72560 Transcript_30442/m.72560 type:complete len:474 (+) Transcript_30442:85-1506(+)